MSVVAFERRQGTGEWSETELSTIVAALRAAIASGEGREWETGTMSWDRDFRHRDESSGHNARASTGCGTTA